MAAEIREQLGYDVTLIPGRGGVFDVEADQSRVFSKHDEGDQFPEHVDVIERLKRLKPDN